MSIFTVENLTKTHGEKVLFDHISFTIKEKQRIGLIGVNGTGKSSLLKVLAGLDTAEEGHIKHAKQFHVEYLPQVPALDEDLTVLEQIYYGDSDIMRALRAYEQALMALERDPQNETKLNQLMVKQQKMDENDAWEANANAKTVLNKLGITDYDKKINALSGGQKKRVAIAKALIQPADLLLLDEPTNHLDNETIEWLEETLAQYPGALMVVTHDRYFLNRMTNSIFELDQGELYEYVGNYETFLEKKAEREAQALATESKRQNLLRRELAWLKRGAKARSTKQKARIQRIDQIKEQKTHTVHQDIEMSTGSTRLGKKVIECENVSKRYEKTTVIQDFDYLVQPGDRIGIIGPNGSGKTTLLNLIAGKVLPDEGTIDIGETVKIGYYTQENEDMDVNMRVIEYVREGAEVIHTVDGQAITAEQMLERFLFPRPTQWNIINKLSGGERRRLYLLRVLMEEPNVLILDEPTNDLDVQTLAILEDYLDHFPGVVITVSHDRYFLDRVVDDLIAFEGSAHLRRFTGNYSAYLETRKSERAEEMTLQRAQEKEKQKENKATAPPNKEGRQKLTYHEQQEWDGIEERIASLEEQQASIEQRISEAGSDIAQVSDLYEEQKKVENELEQAMERWTELSLIVEEIEENKNNKRYKKD
ncbi:ATP-binding cassette domain-containing protein [Caldalkalibacillus salinus]|uniref:ABC transporter ATP-binding protein n=1 Tax=Caldalkalibacillus salinus TaxID=2803787 RepID=UPI0019221D63|nr:ATP-binding cassette domain-containing protein [Caldalkalibacillus salinus]